MGNFLARFRTDGKTSPWLIALTVMLATFMEVLDTSVANVSLPHIAGDLSAGVDESTWTPVTASTKASARVTRIPLKQAAGAGDVRLATAEMQWVQERSIPADAPGQYTRRDRPPAMSIEG